MTLVDTSVWVHALRSQGDSTIRQHAVSLLGSDAELAICRLIRLELLAGTKSDAEYGRLSGLLEGMILLDLSPAGWLRAEQAAYRLRRSGITVPLADLLIAATACEHGCILLHDDKHFPMMAGLPGLKERSVREGP